MTTNKLIQARAIKVTFGSEEYLQFKYIKPLLYTSVLQGHLRKAVSKVIFEVVLQGG